MSNLIFFNGILIVPDGFFVFTCRMEQISHIRSQSMIFAFDLRDCLTFYTGFAFEDSTTGFHGRRFDM